MLTLPLWPPKTVAVLTTVGPDGPHAIPVSSPVRAGDRSILISLHRSRRSLGRIEDLPRVALLVTADGVAFTARGTARIVAHGMAGAPDFAAVEIIVGDVDDHLTGVSVRIGLDDRIDTLLQLVAIRRRCRAAARPEEA
ncbi:pyridoxamine 5'-phosphate oxidase family protein [Spirillospora sp. NPDC047279]|uniref:pyridoxamine 5'-phosphate oxidase family protein n=1 Tax=Spirillospora sp. NPDC047279 TaxID=3155478 RepID=UPI0033E2DB4E